MGAVLLAVTIRARRTDRERAALLLWGGALVSTGLVISLAPGHHPPLLHRRTGGAARRPRRDRDHGSVAAPCRAGWAGSASPPALAVTVVWSYMLLGRTSDWFPALRPVVAVVGSLGVIAILALPLLRSVPKLADRPRRRPRARRRPRRTPLLHGRHGGHAAQRGDPVGHAVTRRWPRRAGRRLPRQVVRGRVPTCLRRRASPVRAPGPAASPARAPGPAASRRAAASPGGAAPSFGGGSRRRGPSPRLRRRWRWWVPELEPVQPRAQQAAPDERQPLHMGRRHGELEQRRRLPTRERRARDGHRRVQRDRPRPDARPVREVRVGGQDPLLHRRLGRLRRRLRGWPGGAGGTSNDASQITSWVESHFTAETVGGVSVYDLSS